MNTTTKKIYGLSQRFWHAIHTIVLIAMLHSTVVLPAQTMFSVFNDLNKYHINTSVSLMKVAATSNPISYIENQSIQPLSTKKYSAVGYTFSADRETGLIGYTHQVGFDSPKDNFFTVTLSNDVIQSNKQYILEYDVFGLDKHSSIAKSINNHFVVGGNIVKCNSEWSTKREVLNPKWIQQNNTIFFTVPNLAKYYYKIKNVKIRVEEDLEKGFVLCEENLVKTKENETQIQGFISDISAIKWIKANHTFLNVEQNMFNGIVTTNNNLLDFTYEGNNGKIYHLTKQINTKSIADTNLEIEQPSFISQSAEIYACSTVNLDIDGFSIRGNSEENATTNVRIERLRKTDLAPLESGMVNVTKGQSGYRVSSNGAFNLLATKVELQYDLQLIPDGYTAKDIKTFYFDRKQKTWVPAHFECLDEQNKLIISYGGQQTDYINGIIQSPESPQTSAFTPTMMNDVKAANPASQLTLMSPPSVSQKGDANLSYPIKIPAGRNGMQPQIGLHYNSDAGNGWLGEGWNISTPSITLDTRWGAPTFDLNSESEMYNLNGEQLMYPKLNGKDWMPNRHFETNLGLYTTQERARIPNAVFTYRKQNSFDKIERIGDSPSNYHWKVTSTSGTISWYGGKDELVNNAVIKNDQGNIVHWSLYMVEDVYGNNIKYNYTSNIISNASIPNENINGGLNYQIQEILYTGFQGNEGNYKIKFENQNTFRNDITINNKLGLKLVEPYLLDKIKVLYDDTLIRSYRFVYGLGKFNKVLLVKAVESNSDNSIENEHKFDYYDDVFDQKEGDILFVKGNEINLDTSLNPDYALNIGNTINASKLNSTQKTELSWDLRPAAGIEFFYKTNNPQRHLTVGLPFGESYSDSKGKVTFVDVNGDGWDDILMKKNGKLIYFPRIVNEFPESVNFGSDIELANVDEFSKAKSKTKTMFLESFDLMVGSFYLGRKRFKTNESTSVFLNDSNSDGLVDVVKNGKVYFNTGNNVFETTTENTPNLLITADTYNPEVLPNPVQETTDFEYDKYDVVRIWEAPYDGVIKISDELQFYPTTNTSKVLYSIETKLMEPNALPFRIYLKEFSNTITQENINILNYSGNNPPLGNSSGILQVKRGQKIFFRVHKNINIVNDVFKTSPIITYLISGNITDSNAYDTKIYKHSEGFKLDSGTGVIEVNQEGTVTISWPDLPLNNLSDDVKFKISKKIYDDSGNTIQESVLFEYDYVANSYDVLGGQTLQDYINIKKDQNVGFTFEVISDSNINWNYEDWYPLFQFSSNENTATDSFTKYAIPTHTIFQEAIDLNIRNAGAMNTPYVFKCNTITYSYTKSNTSYYVKPIIPVVSSSNPYTFSSTDTGYFTFVVKKNGVLLGKRNLYINQGTFGINDNSPILIEVLNASDLSNFNFEYYVDGPNNLNLFYKYTNNVSYASGCNLSTNNVLSFIQNAANIEIGTYNQLMNPSINSLKRVLIYPNTNLYNHLGGMHRNWGQFAYNSNFNLNALIPYDQYSKLIDEKELEFNVNQLSSLYSSCQNATSTTEEYENCVNNSINSQLNLPPNNDAITFDNVQGIVDTIAQNPILTNTSVNAAFMQMEAKIELDNLARRWNGNFVNQYSEKEYCRAGELQSGIFPNNTFGDDQPELPELPINANTGMFAVDKDYRSVALSYSAGYGLFTTSYSKSSYSNLLSDFVDLNGDRYPDIITSNSYLKTTKTGGHKLSNQIALNPVNASKNYNVSMSVKLGYPIAGRSDIDLVMNHITNGFIPADNGMASSSSNIGLNSNLAGNNKEIQSLIDLNGDGLTDFYNENGGVKFNYGSYFNSTNENFYNLAAAETKPSPLDTPSISLSTSDIPNNLPFSVSAGYSSSNGNTSKVYIDVNGDGLPDLITLNSSGGEVRFNLGNKFSSTPMNLNYSQIAPFLSLLKNSKQTAFSLSGSYSKFKGKCVVYLIIPIFFAVLIIPFLYVKAGATVSGSANLSVSEANKEFKDLNGDGHLDFISKDGNKYFVYYSRIKRTNKLKQVTNPIGGSFVLDYEPQKVTYDNPHPKWALTSVTINDGYDLLNDGEDSYTSYFSYVNGKYDRREREFYGYEKVIEQVKKNNAIYRTTATEYHNQNYFLNGLVKKATVSKGQGTDANQVYSTSENNYKIYTTNEDGTINLADEKPVTFDVGGKEGRRQASVLLQETTSTVYEFSNEGITSKVAFDYDAYGRVEKYTNSGNIAIDGDEYTTEIKYHSLANNILQVPKQVTVSVNGQNMRYRETEVNYNTGEISKIIVKLNDNENAVSNYEYDEYGNLLHVVLPSNIEDQNMTYSYAYDDNLHKYVTQVTDAFGYSSGAEYDPLFDVLLKSKDIAGNIMNYTYDSLGRLTQITAPKEQPNGYTIKMSYFNKFSELQNTTYQNCVEASQFMPVAITQHFDSQHPENPIETITFIDGLAKAVQVKKDIELNLATPESPDYKEYMSVSGATTIDELGRAIKQFHPTKELKECSLNMQINQVNDPDANYFTETQYDELDRAIKTIDPAGVESLISFDLASDVFGNLSLHSKAITNQNASTQIITDSYKDIQGRTTCTKNVGPDGDLWTKFNYNAIGELKSYSDAQDLETKYEYDFAGRKVFMQNPDRGIIKYLYDKASNLVRLQTAKLAINDNYVTYKYNFNRLEHVVFPEQNGQPNLSNVNYKFGDIGSGNQTGRLVYQEDATGTQQFKYGNMGELIYNKRIIAAPNLPTRAFETHFNYDSFNRIQELIYPDGEKLNYTYNLGGNLIKMQGEVQNSEYNYVAQIDYDHFEQRTYIKYGNQTENRYTYTPDLRRLDNLISKASNGQEMLNNSYSYDQVGNVTQLLNTASVHDFNQLGGSYSHSYAYDNLNRLVGAQGSFAGHHAEYDENIASYGLSMNYNATHGIVTKKQEHIKNNVQVEDNTYKHHYAYVEGTHKVEKIAGGNVTEFFKYDANGNMEHRSTSTGEERHMLWDESDRLRVLLDNNQMHHFIYDAGGNRTLKASSHFEQVFENGQLVENQNITLENYTTYASAYLVIDPNKQYSKHYFVGSERIATQLGDKELSIFEESTYLRTEAANSPSNKAQQQVVDLQLLLKAKGIKKISFAPYKKANVTTETAKSTTAAPNPTITAASITRIYFFHNDHLGTSTILTDGSGNPYQFFLNLPFGETMFEQHSYTEDYNNPYKFNGKELDEETGFYYYGARYYDPKISLWLSTDPLAEKFPAWSPYNYTMNNPINLIDPDGRAPEPPKNGIPQFIDNTGVYFWNIEKKAYEQYKYTDSSREHYSFSGYYTVNSNSKAVGKSVSIDPNANNFKYESVETSLQEVNVGFGLSLRVGGLSVSFGPELAVGNASNGLNLAGRFNGNFTFDARKFLSADSWSQSKLEVKATAGAKFSDEPTLVSGFKTSTSSFYKNEASIFGTGGEFKISQPLSNSNTTSYSIGVKAGAAKPTSLNPTIGTETKSIGTSLATDKSCY